MEKGWDSEAYVTTYNEEVIISADKTFTSKTYESNTDTYGDSTETYSGTYTYSNGTLTLTADGQTMAVKVYINNNKYLILGDENTYSANAYLKQ